MSRPPRIERLRSQIDRRLKYYLSSEGGVSRSLLKAMEYGVFSGGKRVRPVIALVSCGACGGSVDDALAAACAVEMIHTYSLIHDDLPAMDDDDMRRGKPSLHRAFGEAMAILAGDALLTRAFEITARYSPKDASGAITSELARASGAMGMVGGQVLDLESAGRKKSASAMRRINMNKTARLFEASARVGAMSALADGRSERALAVFGRHLGLLFQITDDIIDGGPYVASRGLSGAGKDARLLAGKAIRATRVFGSSQGELISIVEKTLARKN